MNVGVSAGKLLRCSAFEEFMLDQDSSRYPCVICLRTEFSGPLDQDRWQLALAKVVERHPLLRAKLEWHWGKLYWRIHAACDARVQRHTTAAPAWPHQRYFDLKEQFGFQFDLYQLPSADTWTFFLQMHHGLIDGLSCFEILEELLVEYHGAVSARDNTPPLDKLHSRNRFGLNLVRVLKLIPSQVVGLAGVWQFLSRRPVPMHLGPAEKSAPSITATHYQCSIAQTQQLKQLANQQQVTLNDLLACLVFRACDQIRRSQTKYKSSDWLRMMVPVSLRDSQSAATTVCNQVSCVFLDRSGQQISQREELLESIHQEMALIKRNRLAFIFIFSLWIKKICRVRFRPKAFTIPPRHCQTSIVFSNLGRLFEPTSDPTAQRSTLPTTGEGRLHVGQLTLETCQLLAPIAPLMHVAITTFQYAGRIVLCLRYDPGTITSTDADRLLELVVKHLEVSTAEQHA